MIFLVCLLGAAGATLAIHSLLFRKPRLLDRVEPYLVGLRGEPSRLLAAGGSRHDNFMSSRIGMMLSRLLPATSEELARRLQAAGLNTTANGFRLAQLTWAVGAVLLVWLVAGVGAGTGITLDVPALALVTLLSFVGGFLARDWWLGRQIHARRIKLQQELPTAIDLVTLSIMAGEPVVAAFERVALHLGEGIGTEFQSVVADVRAGSTVLDALDALKQRASIAGMSRFVDALSTGIERGSALADVLSAQADDGREARRRILMELGGKREILMLLPVVFLIMPVVVVFALLPGLVSLDLLVP